MASKTVKKILVTGGNAGIGFALCKQLAAEHGCHVYLCARTLSKGNTAVAAIKKSFPSAQVEMVYMDVSSDESVVAAAKKLAGTKLYAIVNNAGVAGKTTEVTFNTNLYGPKRICEAFLPMLESSSGRIVNVSSGSASSYMKRVVKLSKKQKAPLLSFDVTWSQIEAVIAAEHKANGGTMTGGWNAYGASKAALTAYTMTLAKQHPSILSVSCSPGWVQTKLTGGSGNLTPEQGTLSIRHCLFSQDIGKGKKYPNGAYFGSDGKRSPLHCSRDPGTPEYVPGTNYP